jgi:hypothetical protein
VYFVHVLELNPACVTFVADGMLYTCPMSSPDDAPADDVVVWLGSKYYGDTVPGKEVSSNRKKCLKDWILREGEGAWAEEKRVVFCKSNIGKALDEESLRWILVDVTLPRAPKKLAWKKAKAVATNRKSVHVSITEENMGLLFSKDVAAIVERAWKK